MYVCGMAAGQLQPSGMPVPCFLALSSPAIPLPSPPLAIPSPPPRPVTWTISSHLGDPVPVVDVRGCGTLGERVVTGIGEVMAVSISTVAVRKGF